MAIDTALLPQRRTLIKSSIGVDKIKKSVVSFNESIENTQKTTLKINQTLVQSNRQKQSTLVLSRSNFQKRRESVRRREREDIIEASGISGAIKRQGKVISSSTKGFLGRILDFAGTLLVGWLVNNLPTIIKLGEQLIGRIGKLVGVLRSFVSNLTTTLSGFGGILTGSVTNFIKFDFSDDSRLISNSFDKLKIGMNGMTKDFDDAVNILKQPLDFGFGDIKIKEPSGGSEPEPGGGGGGGGQGIESISKLIAKSETGSRYNAYAGDKGKGDPNITQMSLSQLRSKYGDYNTAVGAYQFMPGTAIGLAKQMGMDPNKTIFTPEFQDKLNIFHLKQLGYDKFISGKMTQQEFGIAIAKQYRAIPDPRTGRTYADKDAKDNAAQVPLDEFNAVLKGSKEQVKLPASQIKGKTLGYSQAVAFGKSLLAKGYKNIWQHPDFNWRSGYTGSGKERVAPRDYNSYHNYGEALDISAYNGDAKLDALYAELNKNKGKYGIAELLWRVKDHYDHLHISFNKLGSTLTESSPAAQVASAKPVTEVTKNITQERKGQTIVVPIPEQQVAQAPSPSGGGSSGSSSFRTLYANTLNRYADKKQLLDLAYA